MNDAESYDVLRLIEHNRRCYISSDYVEGKPLIQWLKFHPHVEKEEVFRWIHEMARGLLCIHKCQGGACYRYMTPYCIIVTKDRELYFLDMSAESNLKILNKVNHRSVRENFLPPGEQYFRTASIELDIYGFVKTVQYLLSEAEVQPSLGKREEAKLQRIISRCLNRQSKRAYSDMPDLQKDLPDYKKEYKKKTTSSNAQVEKRKGGRRRFLMFLMLVTIIGVLCYRGVRGSTVIHAEKEKSTLEKSEENGGDNVGGEAFTTWKGSENGTQEVAEAEVRYIRRLGLVYFLQVKDYEKSHDYFKLAKEDPVVECLDGLTCHLSGREQLDLKKLRSLLEKLEQEVKAADVQEDMQDLYLCLMRGYALLEEDADAKKLIQIGEKLLDMEPERGLRRECLQYIALAAEKVENWDMAADGYQELLDGKIREQSEDVRDVRENIYQNLANVWWQKGDQDKAFEICRTGIEEYRDSVSLRIQYIHMQCKDVGIDREICAQTIQEYIREVPELKEDEAFKKLIQEYGIVIEGENVWVGR